MKVPLALDLVHNPIIHGASFIRVPTKTDGCIFCALPRNIVRECPATLEYDNTGDAIVNSTSPTDGPSRTACRLKHGINTWLTANDPWHFGETLVTAVPLSVRVNDKLQIIDVEVLDRGSRSSQYDQALQKRSMQSSTRACAWRCRAQKIA